ncbi:MAG TPA: hypothetical protein VHC49_10780 [Mycobacteriales bacterium]|nr:hypothetical protein [Mycobacteriales bacterium]
MAAPPPLRLPEISRADLAERRFESYILNPEHRLNQKGKGGRKTDGFLQLGYNLDDGEPRHASMEHIVRQIRPQLGSSPTERQEDTPFGQRYQTQTVITGPNGRKGTAVASWQIDKGESHPRLLTLWLEVHQEGRDR